MHRYMVTKLIMAECRILRDAFGYLKGLKPAMNIGSLWLGLCPQGGTSINIAVLDKVFNYTVKILANLYEVITCNDTNSFYVGILAHTSATTDAIVARFWANEGKIQGGFRHYVHPGDPEDVDKMAVQSWEGPNGSTYLDGGVEFSHIAGSFTVVHSTAPIEKLRMIIQT